MFESAAPLLRRAFDSVCHALLESTLDVCRARHIAMLYDEWSENRASDSLRRLHTAIGEILADSTDGSEE